MRLRDDHDVAEAAVVHDEAKLVGEAMILDPFPAGSEVSVTNAAAVLQSLTADVECGRIEVAEVSLDECQSESGSGSISLFECNDDQV